MGKSLIIFTVIAAVLLISTPQLWAKTFYLKNGEQIEYKSYWKKNGRICLLITRDTMIDFAPSEVALNKTRKSAGIGKKHKHRRHVLHRKHHAASSHDKE
jgi:spermidine synthase